MIGKTDKLSDKDIDKIAELLDNRLIPLSNKMATQDGVEEAIQNSETRIKNELKGYIDEGVETIMGGVDNIAKQLTEKEKFDRLAKWAREVSKKVGVRIDI